MTPFEIIGAPLTLWVAPIGTAFPTISAAPGVGWTLVGTNGDRNYENGGVTVTHRKTYDKVRTAGATGPVKAFLSEEDLMFGVTLLDITLEQYALALNGNTITTVAPATGQPGTKRIGLSEAPGLTKEYALLARGLSPYNEALGMQFEIPRCFQSGAPAPVFRKGGTGAGLALQFEALENLAATNAQERFGVIRAAHLPGL
ncbi:hypothetical protein [Erythrobacter sp. WG]|uniref:hypothetical protein n=1 Tax=Erythrobacter sp. WG TaxID=2985510 RepID=UPI00226F59A7|nr:hypothetical protein [Erythrobacter sp. WG]MCX9146620.1 hypothetical protein [Erythrobacter sp. WG]